MSTSLATYVLLFPLWFSLTQQAPLTYEQINLSGARVLSAELAQTLQAGYAELTSAEKAKLLTDIRTDSGDRAQKLMLGWLKQESDVFVQASILVSLGYTDLATIPEGVVRSYLHSPVAMLRNAAVRLYTKLPEANFGLLDELLLDIADPGFQVALLEGLTTRADTAFQSFPAPVLLKFANQAEHPEIEAAALVAALSKQGEHPEGITQWQTTAAHSELAMLRRAAASDPYVESVAPAVTLAQDPHPAVRLAVFQSFRKGLPDAVRQLLELPADSDPVVRAARLEMLGRLAEVPDLPAVRRVLLEGFADAAKQVRDAAEATLSGENMPRSLALELTSAALADAHDSSRLIAYRQIVKRSFAELLENARLRSQSETLSENIEAALEVSTALKSPGDAADLDYARPYTTHRSPLVRKATVKLLGRLQVPHSEETIIRMATTDNHDGVRANAYEAMGYFPKSAFLPTLEGCFNDHNGGGEHSRARSAACWAVSRIRPETPEDHETINQIAYRIYILATQPTIMDGMGGLIFDDNFVIANGLVAMARLLKAYPEQEAITQNGKRLLTLYKDPITQETSRAILGTTTTGISSTEVLNNIARQGLQFLADEEFIPGELQLHDFSPLLNRVKVE